MDIRFVKRSEIDKVKWNSCVHYAANGNIFGYIWYLDHVAKEWHGLVEGDYESVFPLVWRRDEFGRLSLYQPSLMRAMGIYSVHILSQARIRAFLQAIPDEYKLIDITLNEQNRPAEDLGFEVKRLTNHQLPLNQPFEVLEANFSPVVKERETMAEADGLYSTSSLKPETIAGFYREHIRSGYRERDFHALQRIMYNVLHRGWGYVAGVQTSDQELLAVDFFIVSHHKLMSLVPVESPEGAKKGALTFLYLMMLRGNANKPLILDFNTSEKDELAIGLGALPNPYYHLHRNRRWLGVV